MNPSQPSIATQAQALVESVERTLKEQEERLRAMGLEPWVLRQAGRTLSAPQLRQAEDRFRADMADVEQAAAEANARSQAGAPGTGASAGKTRRRFI